MQQFISIFTTQWGSVVRWWNGLLDNIASVCFGLLIFILMTVLSRKLANWISKAFSKLFRKWPSVEQGLYVSLRAPLRGFIIMTGIFALFKLSGTSGGFDQCLNKMYGVVSIALITWALMNLTPTITKVTIKLHQKNSQSSEVAIRFVANIMKLVIVSIAVCIIISELGYNINGIITGLGLGGLTLSLAAKNAASNLFSGFEIVSDRPFDIGDYIRTPSVEGTVEDMTMRSTRIRTLDDLLIVMPNSKLMDEPITNFSAMGKRFTKTQIGLDYDTSNYCMRRIIRQIKAMLQKDDKIDNGRISIAFTGFGESSLDIQIIYFTKTTNYDEYLKVNEEVNFRIRDIVEQNGSSFAYPCRSLYVERMEEPEVPPEIRPEVVDNSSETDV